MKLLFIFITEVGETVFKKIINFGEVGILFNFLSANIAMLSVGLMLHIVHMVAKFSLWMKERISPFMEELSINTDVYNGKLQYLYTSTIHS
jgi:hypothetical protein